MIHESFRTYSMNYFRNLDGLRFLAVFSVMIAHWIKNVPIDHLPGLWCFSILWIEWISHYKILFQNKADVERSERTWNQELKNFYICRLLRIFPLFCAADIIQDPCVSDQWSVTLSLYLYIEFQNGLARTWNWSVFTFVVTRCRSTIFPSLPTSYFLHSMEVS